MPRRIGAVIARIAPPVVAAVIVIFAWQLIAEHNPYVLPRPRAVAKSLIDNPRFYLHSTGVTLREALLGLVIGYSAGVAVAIVMTLVRIIDRGFRPLAILLNVTPVIAVAPALDVAFGFGIAPKVIMTAVICFFPTLVNALAGLRSADPQVLEVLRTLHASPGEVLFRVRLPSSLPFLFTAARIGLPLSVIGAVVSEFVSPGSTAGLGTVISQAASNSQLDQVYACIACLAVLGVSLTGIVAFAERRLLSWHPQQSRS